MTPKDFQHAARDLADRLDAMPMFAFATKIHKAPNGEVTLPRIEYNPIAAEWVEFINPWRLDSDVEAYEAVARRGWENAKLIATAPWSETIHIAATLIRAQRSRGGDILQQGKDKGMLSGVLRRLADLADGPDAQRFNKAQILFSAPDTPSA